MIQVSILALDPEKRKDAWSKTDQQNIPYNIKSQTDQKSREAWQVRIISKTTTPP